MFALGRFQAASTLDVGNGVGDDNSNKACIGQQADVLEASLPGGIRNENPTSSSLPGGVRNESSRNPTLPIGSGSGSLSDPSLSSEFERAYRPSTLQRDDCYAKLFPVNVPVYAEPMHYVASVQSFSRGGYEVVIRMVNAQKIAEQSGLVRPNGSRCARPEEERNDEDVLRSQFRAKKQVRYRVKEMAADRILTLTTREHENSVEDLLDKWQRWLKLVDRASYGHFHYVAVPEPHPTNPKHFHLHVAVAVFLNVNVLRRCWWQVCGGRGMGNIHIKRLKAGDGERRICRVASYISKYITKDNVVRFNKKRYWSSRIELPAVKRYWLKARTLSEAMCEAFDRLRFRSDDPRDVWIDHSLGIVWFQAVPGVGQEPPF
jgi:hypothetical protein